MTPNRIAVYLTIAADLAAGLAPFIVDFGGSEKIAAYVATILAANAVVVQWLKGWSQYELQEANRGALPGADEPHVPVGLGKSE